MKGRRNYKAKDLKAIFGFKPLIEDRRSLIISSEDIEPTEFGSIRKAAKAIGVSEGYAKKNGRNLFKDANAFFHKVMLTLSHIKCLIVISKRDLTRLIRE